MSTYAGLRPGQVAAAAGVNLQTLRYYENRGLLERPDRSLGGHRLYRADTVTVLRVIKTAQRLGFTLTEIAELLDTARHRHGPGAGHRFQERARQRLTDVEARIAELELIAQTLREAIAVGCDDLIECAAVPGCPLPFARLADSAEPAPADRPRG
ncbi:MerR family transcriptional regulator [Granulicoccus phenolivorans]|uniref:MerR family transcriptional regulator n=1 Tax=Granulicoccus phenolivorans TaxID=266854 RepID=UPI0004024334|nr:MerR family transcriptional regulator [Granulicoccus phenolivorans]